MLLLFCCAPRVLRNTTCTTFAASHARFGGTQLSSAGLCAAMWLMKATHSTLEGWVRGAGEEVCLVCFNCEPASFQGAAQAGNCAAFDQ